MSAVVTIAGNLRTDPELAYTRAENKTFVACRVLANRRAKDDAGDWVDADLEIAFASLIGDPRDQRQATCDQRVRAALAVITSRHGKPSTWQRAKLPLRP